MNQGQSALLPESWTDHFRQAIFHHFTQPQSKRLSLLINTHRNKCIKAGGQTRRAVSQSRLPIRRDEGCRHERHRRERRGDDGQGEDRVPRLGAVHRQRDYALREDLWQELRQRGRIAINSGWSIRLHSGPLGRMSH